MPLSMTAAKLSGEGKQSDVGVRRGIVGARLPREGASKGGGQITREICEINNADGSSHCQSPIRGTASLEDMTQKGRIVPPVATTWSGGSNWTQSPRGSGIQPMSGTRKLEAPRAAVVKRQRQVDALREDDQRRIQSKVEERKQWRDDRFSRLLCGIRDGTSQVAEVMLDMPRREIEDETHRSGISSDWHENVFHLMECQLYDYMNPPYRNEQHHLAGSKSVGFLKPSWQFRLHPDADPLKKQLTEHLEEEAFDREAKAFLGQGLAASRSSPDLRRATSAPSACPWARSRPVLEPTEWDGARLQTLPCGRYVAEPGALPLGRRTACAPPEKDGVVAAGRRSIRAGPRAVAHGDGGLLRRDGGPARWGRGEAAQQRSAMGASSGAPAQDHYTYERGSRVTDMEFPLGKRLYPR